MEQSENVTLPTPEEVDSSTDVIYDFFEGARRVVGLPNNLAVKYGQTIDVDEAKVTAFVGRHTSIPVPTIVGTYSHNKKNYIVMTRIKGTPLSECLSSLSQEQIESITKDLARYLNELRSLKVEEFEGRSYIGSPGFGSVKGKMLQSGTRERGPFATVSEFHGNICSRFWDAISWADRRNEQQDWNMHLLRRMYAENSDYKIVFCHGDLHPSNILVDDGRVVGILDWQRAGWYPEYWEYVSCMFGGGEFYRTPWLWCVEKVLESHDYIRLIELPIRQLLS